MHPLPACCLTCCSHICVVVMYRVLMSQQKALLCDPETLS